MDWDNPSKRRRSIPARAGEPYHYGAIGRYRRVYPRACGGTADSMSMKQRRRGLSPRVRGNLNRVGDYRKRQRSIPARAGEPGSACALRRHTWVYPRACGGTHHRPDQEGSRGGLSPRVRGNPNVECIASPRKRSIPARAGEPYSGCKAHSRPRVYPRACGGTPTVGTNPPAAGGLSPRVRGNLSASASASGRVGSIPARAGEPRANGVRLRQAGVYPRACGGTDADAARRALDNGLSPRVRGNPRFTPTL